jgi:rhodanese-related sulfurtransferase
MRKVGRVVLEGLLVTVVGVGLALAANSKSPRGLIISKDYFKLLRSTSVPVTQPGPGPVSRPATNPASMPETGPASKPGNVPESQPVETETDKLIKQKGFNPIKYDEVLRLYKSEAENRSNAYLFIDAREEAHFKEGHMPLAWRIDHAKPEETIKSEPLNILLPGAEKIILYCNGGDCEDSLLVAGDLRDAQFDPAKIYVYEGGFTEWAKKKQPVEKGERGSGDITNGGGQ